VFIQPEVPGHDEESAALAGRKRGGWRFGITLTLLFVGTAGLAASAAGVSAQLLPRKFTTVQQQEIMNWEAARRWRVLPAGKIFPATIAYQLPAAALEADAGLPLKAYRVGISQQTSCTLASAPAAARVLSAGHCSAMLRATYADETDSMLVTVGVAVMPSARAATSAAGALSAGQELRPGIRAVAFGGTLAASFGQREQQLSWATSAGPYLILSTAGYADGRPEVPVSSDTYIDREMTNLANGVADAVAAPLGAAPPVPKCPGAPGC
jgi:hypothetical protein